MRPQFSIRTVLAFTSIVAIAGAWYVMNASTRAIELKAIGAIQRSTKHGVSVAPVGTTVVPRPGTVIHVEDTGPSFLRSLRLDAFKRVVAVEFDDETNPEILAHVREFGDLETLSFRYRSSYLLTRPLTIQSTEVLELIGAIRLFIALHPEVDVDYPDRPTPADKSKWEI